MQYDLSIIIPSRNEEFLVKTIEDILEHKRGKTEIIVGLDGWWPSPGIADNPDVTIYYVPEAIGQRSLSKRCARLSNAKYIAKVDAHCSFDEGFDVKMLEAFRVAGDNSVIVPVMRNLHVFDWVCSNGHRRYQGPSGVCEECGAETKKDIVWIPKTNPQSVAYCFDAEPHFQYDNGRKKTEAYKQQGDLTETMSLQGSFFMMTKEKYFELDVDDESWGSWGSQGISVACRFWLSGGKVLVNHNTWYAHLFRTQGGDFSFPYPQSGKTVSNAKKKAREVFFANKWEKQIYPLSWLVERFWPVPHWTEEDRQRVHESDVLFSGGETVQKGIIYYTDNQLTLKIAKRVQKQLLKANIPIVSASLKPMTFGKNVRIKADRGYVTMARQIVAALEASNAEIVFFAEHDVLYDPSHFDFTPERKDAYYYNTNLWEVRASDGHAVYKDDCKKLSQLVGYRETLLTHFRKRLRLLEDAEASMSEEEFSRYIRKVGFEPGTHGRPERVDDIQAISFSSKVPSLDIRHETNLTPNRWNKDQFRNEKYTRGWKEADSVEGWGVVTFA